MPRLAMPSLAVTRTPLLIAVLAQAGQLAAQDIQFGTDDGEWANDGECDDRRFFGPGMAVGLSWEYAGLDATDCRAALEAGEVRLWDMTEARAATVCAAIDFGTDEGEYPQDGECDDLRFEGPAVARVLDPGNIGGDASDCARMCFFGVLAVRDY